MSPGPSQAPITRRASAAELQPALLFRPAGLASLLSVLCMVSCLFVRGPVPRVRSHLLFGPPGRSVVRRVVNRGVSPYPSGTCDAAADARCMILYRPLPRRVLLLPRGCRPLRDFPRLVVSVALCASCVSCGSAQSGRPVLLFFLLAGFAGGPRASGSAAGFGRGIENYTAAALEACGQQVPPPVPWPRTSLPLSAAAARWRGLGAPRPSRRWRRHSSSSDSPGNPSPG